MAEPCKLICHGEAEFTFGGSATYKSVLRCETHDSKMDYFPKCGMCPEGKFEHLQDRIEKLEQFHKIQACLP